MRRSNMRNVETIRNPLPPPPVMPGAILCTIQQARTLIPRSRQFFYDAIAAGLIAAVKSDGRTMIVVQSLHDYVASLPPARIKKKVA
jgi:uncharacterized membrane protein